MSPEDVRSISTVPPSSKKVDVDEDIAGVAGSSMLDEIRAELAQEVELEEVTLPVPGRPGYMAVFSTDIDGEQLSRWRKASKDKKLDDGINMVAYAARILANVSVGIVRRGIQVMELGTTEPLTLASREMLEIYEAPRPLEVVRKFFGVDGHVIAAATRVLEAAGYGDELNAEDPTTPSSTS